MADFGRKAHVESVSISPRTGGCCLARLLDFDIRIGDTKNETANSLCRKSASITVEQTVNIKCGQPQVGRYLYIITNIDQKLTLCEVEVNGFFA